MTREQSIVFHYEQKEKYEKLLNFIQLSEFSRKSLYLKVIEYHENELKAIKQKDSKEGL